MATQAVTAVGRAAAITWAWLSLVCAAMAAAGVPPVQNDPDMRTGWQMYRAGSLGLAAQAYQRAAERGQALGQFNLAMMLMNGEGVPRDPVSARDWLRRAADAGLAVAQYTEGTLYESGNGVPKSQTEAVRWYALAAEQSNADAQMALATEYFLGRGVTQDYALAAKWYERAAQAGVEAAQYIIASCYEHGDGVKADPERALYWYSLAARQGDVAAAGKALVLRKAFTADAAMHHDAGAQAPGKDQNGGTGR